MESPFAHLLPTLSYPPEKTAQDIRDFCRVKLNEIKIVEEEISEVQAYLDRLSHKHDILRKSLLAHQALLSPMRQLPPEILQKIFGFCVGQDPPLPLQADIEENSFDISKAPLLLCRICKGWSRLALSTPELWTYLRIAPSSKHRAPYGETITQRKMNARQICNSMESFLKHSANYPLSIWVSMVGCWDLLLSRQLLRTLATYSHRWRRLYLVLPVKAFDAWNDVGIDGLPCLESIHFGKWSVRGDVDGGMPHSPQFMANLPVLRHLSLPRSDIDISIIPWGQLTELHFDAKPASRLVSSEVFHILSMCSNLRSFTLSDRIQDDSGLRPDLIQLPLLHTLQLVRLQKPYVPLQNLDLPALRHLTVVHDHLAEARAYRGCQGIAALASQTLTSLLLVDFRLGVDFCECLRAVPQLMELSIKIDKRYSAEVDQLFGALTPYNGGQKVYICPNLRRLRVEHAPRIQIAEDFVTFLQARCGSVRPTGITRLEFLIIHFSVSSSDWWQEAIIQPYIKEGIDIHVTF